MSSMQQAFRDATESVLQDVLAPELAHQLAQQIIERARPELQAAIEACVGAELLSGPPAKSKADGRVKRAKSKPITPLATPLTAPLDPAEKTSAA